MAKARDHADADTGTAPTGHPPASAPTRLPPPHPSGPPQPALPVPTGPHHAVPHGTGPHHAVPPMGGPQPNMHGPHGPHPMPGPMPGPAQPMQAFAPMPPAMPSVTRRRAYRFVLDAQGRPVELGSGRSGKVYLGEEHWLESKTAFRRRVAIKILQKGVTHEDGLRFQMEKELLERVQGHPDIIHLYASGESDAQGFIPQSLHDLVEEDYVILELCDMSLEERLKGSRGGEREDLLAYEQRDRLFRVLEYMLPVASAVEHAHLICNVSHRDIKPGNILLRLPDPRLEGSTLAVRLADFNVGKVHDEAQDLSVTRFQGVPGTLFFQAPEQETNAFEVLVNVEQGSHEVTYFEDFYVPISQNDGFELFNRGRRYAVAGADRRKKKIFLERPYEDIRETNVRAKIVKSVDRPADIYSLGAILYFLISGAYGNPKTLYDAFHKFIEYDGNNEVGDDHNTVDAYVEHEYSVINSLRAPKVDEHNQPVLVPADRFFSYKHYLDGNGELIDKEVLKIVAKSMIRNKPDSYCQAWEVSTAGISEFVRDLRRLYGGFGTYVPSRPGHLVLAGRDTNTTKLGRWWQRIKDRRG
jgi:serine/threonine protein kinase